MMYARYPLSAIRCRCARSWTFCLSAASISATRRSGSGGPGSARCSLRRSVSDVLIPGPYSQWRWHLDEVFVRINGETRYLWRAVDHEGEVLEVFATKHRDRRSALKFLTRTMQRYGRPRSIVPDGLRSYRAATKIVGVSDSREYGRWLINRAENSHQPFRRRERAIARFRSPTTLQKSAAAHASVENHFNRNCQLNRRDISRQDRAAALARWLYLAA